VPSTVSTNAQEKWALLAEAWSRSTPPSSPSHDDVVNYLSRIPNNARRVLVLGCTPSIRKALRDQGASSLAVDVSSAMIAVSRRLLPIEPHDYMVSGDWLRLPVRSQSVDAVLGDKVFGNLLPEMWPSMVDELWRVARPGAALLTRATPHGDEALHVEMVGLAALVNRWARRAEEGLPLTDACSGLWESCMDESTENYSPTTGTQQLARVLPLHTAKLLESGWSSTERQLLTLLLERYGDTRDAIWSAYSRSGLVQAIEKRFRYTGEQFAGDYADPEQHPMFCFIAER